MHGFNDQRIDIVAGDMTCPCVLTFIDLCVYLLAMIEVNNGTVFFFSFYWSNGNMAHTKLTMWSQKGEA